MKDPYSKNYKTVMKVIEDDTNKRYTWLLLKNYYYKNVHMTQSKPEIKCSPYQHTRAFFMELEKNNHKICMEPQKIPNSQSHLEKEEQN